MDVLEVYRVYFDLVVIHEAGGAVSGCPLRGRRRWRAFLSGYDAGCEGHGVFAERERGGVWKPCPRFL